MEIYLSICCLAAAVFCIEKKVSLILNLFKNGFSIYIFASLVGKFYDSSFCVMFNSCVIYFHSLLTEPSAPTARPPAGASLRSPAPRCSLRSPPDKNISKKKFYEAKNLKPKIFQAKKIEKKLKKKKIR